MLQWAFWGVALCTIGLLGGCSPVAERPCASTDKACLRKAQMLHRVRNADFWQTELAKPLLARLGAAPPELMEYLAQENVLAGFPQKPRAVVVDEAFMADAAAALAEIPADIRQLFDEVLGGIFFVEQLGGTGFSDYVTDRQGARTGAFIVLDARVLRDLTANAWATWKESSPFQYDAAWGLSAQIEAPDRDNRKNAIQYILLHELGHVLSVKRRAHPPWDVAPKQPLSGVYPFFDLSWSVDAPSRQYISRFDNDFVQRPDVVYYKGAQLPSRAMPRVYADLEATNFPTLYAATGPGDDFAESFASYVHTVRLGRPWRITLTQHGKTVHNVEACWAEPRCATKRAVLEQMLR